MLARHGELFLAAGGGDDRGADSFAALYRGQADTTAGTMDH